MAKGKKGVDGIDKVIDLFPAGSHKMIERLLARAADRDAKQAGRNVKAAMRALGGRGGRSGGKVLGGLASNLAKALRQRGDVGGGKASIRQKAPDTGGRPFHFAHSVISKEDGAPRRRAGLVRARGGLGAAGGTRVREDRPRRRAHALHRAGDRRRADLRAGARRCRARRGRARRGTGREPGEVRRTRERRGRGPGPRDERDGGTGLHREPGEARQRRAGHLLVRDDRRPVRGPREVLGGPRGGRGPPAGAGAAQAHRRAAARGLAPGALRDDEGVRQAVRGRRGPLLGGPARPGEGQRQPQLPRPHRLLGASGEEDGRPGRAR